MKNFNVCIFRWREMWFQDVGLPSQLQYTIIFIEFVFAIDLKNLSVYMRNPLKFINIILLKDKIKFIVKTACHCRKCYNIYIRFNGAVTASHKNTNFCIMLVLLPQQFISITISFIRCGFGTFVFVENRFSLFN